MAVQAKARPQPVAPPYDHEAERVLLTVAMALPPAIEACAALRPEWFHHAEYRPIWRAILAMTKRGEIATIETLENELRATGHLETAGGMAGIIEAATGSQDNAGAFTTAGARSFARVILECARGRVEIELAQKLAPIAYERREGGLAIILQYNTTLADIDNAILALEGKARISTLIPKGQTARELMAKDIPPPQWAVPGLFASGLTLFGGKPKRGKSTLLLQIIMGVASGGRALGQIAVDRGEALYLALEDNERRMQRRMQRMLESEDGATIPDGMHLFYQWPRLDAGGIDALNDWMDTHPETRIIGIDTYARIKARAQKNSTLYDADYTSLEGLQEWASRRNVAVVVVHHLRKSANPDDPMDEISGSTGLTGVVDNMVVMRAVDNVTVLSRRGRDYLDDEDWALRGDTSTLLWTLEGNAQDVRRSGERNAVLDLLTEHPEGMSPADIARVLGKTQSNIRGLLHRMLHGGDTALKKEGSLYKVNTEREKRPNGPNEVNAPNAPNAPNVRAPLGPNVVPLTVMSAGNNGHHGQSVRALGALGGVSGSGGYFDLSGPGRYESCNACGGMQWGVVSGVDTCMKCRTPWRPRGA